MVKGATKGDTAFIYGKVLDFDTGEPIANAELDIWHSDANGLYEVQDPNQPDMNLRGRFYTNSDGEYYLYCLRPTKYPIPEDGPGGDLLKLLDRHPYRPGHIHFILSAEGYRPVVTQIFDRTSDYVDNDVVFAVKDSLVVDFKPRYGDPKGKYQLEYDFKLASYETAKKQGTKDATGL
jgi:catechol 1,2-dioxygenase